jgi:hypothetical protein
MFGERAADRQGISPVHGKQFASPASTPDELPKNGAHFVTT